MFVNCASIKWAVRFQNMVTYVKMIILAILVVIGLTEVVSGKNHFVSNLLHPTSVCIFSVLNLLNNQELL